MKDLSKRVVASIRIRLHSEAFVSSSRTEPRRFTRKRKISFRQCMVLILDRLTRSLKQELREMFEGEGLGDAPTEQAFSKARQGIKPEAFEELFKIERDEIEQSGNIRRYQGYRVFGIDGSDTILPSSAELWAAYPDLGKEKNRCPHARASLLCELLDGYVLDARLVERSMSERKLAQAHLDALEGVLNERDIILLDRGYPSWALIARFSRVSGPQYVMRVPRGFSPQIDRDARMDFPVTFEHEGEAYTARIVRVTLPTGECETLITSLRAEQFEREAFLALYALRWGVETAYDRIKNQLCLEKFSGRSAISIQQEFYGAMFLLNYAAILATEATVEIEKEQAGKTLTYTYRANFNLIVADLKRHLPDLLLAKSSRAMNKILKQLKRRAKEKPCPVRPGRSFPRPDPSHKMRLAPRRTGL